MRTECGTPLALGGIEDPMHRFGWDVNVHPFTIISTRYYRFAKLGVARAEEQRGVRQTQTRSRFSPLWNANAAQAHIASLLW